MIALPLILLAGGAAAFLFFALDKSVAETPAPVQVALPQQAPATSDAATALQPSVTTEPTVGAPDNTIPPDRVRILRQSFARGGLGSKALVTLTLRNNNNFAIKDPEIRCGFRSKDGRYFTERRRTLNETVDAKSRKIFPYTLIGFVNIRASQAKCLVVTASRE